MAKFRKKPVVIEAHQITGPDQQGLEELAYWCGGVAFANKKPGERWSDSHILIPTLEGEHRANIGDWIIRGVKGEFYPCKPDIFAQTYEAVEDSTHG
jgi:hypothetical protein